MSVESTKVEGGQGLGLNGDRHNSLLDARRDPLSQPTMTTCHHVPPRVKYVYQSSGLKFGQLHKCALLEGDDFNSRFQVRPAPCRVAAGPSRMPLSWAREVQGRPDGYRGK